MNIIPAIDLLQGRCVRLLYGDYEKVTEYPLDPVELAASYREQGTEWIHIVDLDGARGDSSENLATIRRIADIDGLHVQSGGGIRQQDDLRARYDAGVARAVVGSLAIKAPQQVKDWIAEFGESKITLAMDIRLDDDNIPRVATHGWLEQTDITLWDAIAKIGPHARHVLCTDIGRDGAMTGPNIELYRQCIEKLPDIEFQASGGVRHAQDAHDLAAIGMAGAITGKALLEKTLTLKELSPFLQNA